MSSRNKVLNISDSIDQPETLKWDLTLCHLLAWFIIWLCICKGVKSTGKVNGYKGREFDLGGFLFVLPRYQNVESSRRLSPYQY